MDDNNNNASLFDIATLVINTRRINNEFIFECIYFTGMLVINTTRINNEFIFENIYLKGFVSRLGHKGYSTCNFWFMLYYQLAAML